MSGIKNSVAETLGTPGNYQLAIDACTLQTAGGAQTSTESRVVRSHHSRCEVDRWQRTLDCRLLKVCKHVVATAGGYRRTYRKLC